MAATDGSLIDRTTHAMAAIGATMPLWLERLQELHDIAAFLAPILSLAWFAFAAAVKIRRWWRVRE